MSTFESESLPAEARMERSARANRLLDARAAATSVGVTLHTTDDGKTVSAHVGATDHEDRAKLRDRIVALLSRHGLVARGVRIDGTDTASFAKEDR